MAFDPGSAVRSDNHCVRSDIAGAEPVRQHNADGPAAKSEYLPKEVIAMPKFLVTYHGAGAPSPEEAQQAMAAFMAWASSASSDVGAATRRSVR
jgi:hypothetical protein